MNSKERLHLLDEIRGFLIIGVVISHTLFDMHYFFHMDMSWIKSPLFTAISDIGAIIFILISGMVSKYSKDNINRGLKLMCVAATVTLVTHIVVPDFVVYAGILHLLAFAIVLHELIKPLLVKIHRIAGLVINILIALLTANLYGREISIFGVTLFKIPDNIMNGGLSYLLGLKIDNITVSSDYYPILPWITFFFMGFYLTDYIERQPLKSFLCKKRCNFLAKAGRNSLLVYLVHQPVVMGILYLISLI
jgi:uncharacterized membrane protein